mmetsp:Transcript_10755/g.31521  ORF Transcript_10755/g.31521 Transcript_10755/m.31521 type:complete len:94 (+) Transcript_10755:132-413(+)
MASAPQPYSYAVLVVLSLLSGVFSGLNLGLMSLTVEDLNIIIASSTDQKKATSRLPHAGSHLFPTLCRRSNRSGTPSGSCRSESAATFSCARC